MQKTTNNNLIYRWGPALVLMGIIFVISSFPSTSVPNYGAFDFWVKKSGHFLGYAALAFTYCHALGVSEPAQGRKAWALAVIFALSDEVHQSFVPGRSAWIMDVLIDALGSVFGIMTWLVISRKSN